MTDIMGATGVSAPARIDIRNPNQRPTAPTGVPGTAWAWNGTQWVRSYTAFNREQRQQDPASVVQNPTTPIGGGPTAAGGGGDQMSEQSARAIIRSFLQDYNLEGLEDMIYNIVVSDADYSRPRLISEIRQTPQYAARFPGMAARRAAGLPAISEDDYIADEREYRSLMQRAGLPTGFYDSSDDFAKFIGGDVSPAELGRRIQQGYQAVAMADPAVKDTMRRFYGVTDGELAAYFLDPTRAESIIIEQAATARLGATAARMGFAQAADRVAAERMQQLGVSEQEAQQAFGTLAGATELLTPLERGETTLDVTETAIGLTGRGSPEALQRLQTQARRRTARFEGGGRFATQSGDVVGLQQA